MNTGRIADAIDPLLRSSRSPLLYPGALRFAQCCLLSDHVCWRGVQMSEERWVCVSCGYVYDPKEGDETVSIPKGTGFDDLPDDWRCPMCYVGKSEFDLY
jgi:rubredoxin